VIACCVCRSRKSGKLTDTRRFDDYSVGDGLHRRASASRRPSRLSRAARKARRLGARIQLDRGVSDAPDYPEASFDRVLSSFMFHHLERGEKARTLDEIQRVLKPGRSLHLLDFGGPVSPRHRRGLHSHHRLADNDEHTILARR
jgi:SAM-dependent methyltransferase